MRQSRLPFSFIWKRVHSLLGLWLVVFLMEHLLVNSQAPLFLKDKHPGFVQLVDFIHDLPYLPLIEWGLIGIPLLFHLALGLSYLISSQLRLLASDGSVPALPLQGGYRAYQWQRISSCILGIGLVIHVGHFRFINYPKSLYQGKQMFYSVILPMDKKLYTLADELEVTLFSSHQIETLKHSVLSPHAEEALEKKIQQIPEQEAYQESSDALLSQFEKNQDQQQLITFLEQYKLDPQEVVALSSKFGSVTLLSVRSSFQSFWAPFLYTPFLLAACFHACNGLWTFLLTWGVILKVSAQAMAFQVTRGVMVLLMGLGLMAIWGTYFLNLTG
ncbi:MAG: succinate dehydrogenase [Candidatus Rhabdochlamydia sp.]